jgi:NCS1 family nucleobase:cation symporter-1
LLWWAATRAGGLGAMLAGSETLRGDRAPSFLPWVTAMVGFWATLAINIPDFSRFARSQKDQMAGQTLGLLTTMPLFAFIGVAVSSATVILYGEAIWNPVDLITRMSGGQRTVGSVVALVVILVATLTTNIAANIVAPANTFANLNPRRITFRAGGVIAALIGIAILPWKLLDVYQTWLITYSGLLGAVGGVLVCDYVVVRRGVLAVDDLYRPGGAYSYRSGVNPAALIAFAAGVTAAMVGTLVPTLRFLFDGAWFSAGLVAAGVYWALMGKQGNPR